MNDETELLDACLACDRCSGEAHVLIVINAQFVCTECAQRGRNCCE